jgi:hypothetical protein
MGSGGDGLLNVPDSKRYHGKKVQHDAPLQDSKTGIKQVMYDKVVVTAWDGLENVIRIDIKKTSVHKKDVPAAFTDCICGHSYKKILEIPPKGKPNLAETLTCPKCELSVSFNYHMYD